MERIAHIKPVMKEILDFIISVDLLQLEMASKLLCKSVRTTAADVLVHISVKLYEFDSMDQVIYYLKFLTARTKFIAPITFSLFLNSYQLRSDLLEFQHSFLAALDSLLV